ncbi:MAG: MerR family transcriptional regulator [Candidatus Solibacter sp.]|nr:MerR family transcriptional regulator [Candidatus Solibacter sp.]
MSDSSLVGYPIRAVSKLTGISIDALRAWERRYKAVVPNRTTRGRLYDASQVRRLTLLRDATKAGHAISSVSKLEDPQIEALLAAPAARATPLDAGSGQTVLKPVLAAIENYDYTGANSELGVLASLLPVPELIARVVHPLMDLVGQRWYNGTLTVAQEHMVSVLLRNLLGGLVRLYHPREPRVRLIFATPASELHEFGILCGAMLAVAVGLEAIYLGPNLPTPEIISITNRLKPHALVLGVVAPAYVPDLEGALGFIAAQIPPATEVWVGGRRGEPAIPGIPPGRIIFLEDFESMQPHLVRLLEAAR